MTSDKPPCISICGREAGLDHDPLVIAEIGINHGGSIDVALEMVDAAAAAGAEIVKHQTHVIEDEMIPAAREVIPENAEISIYEIMESCALNEDEERALKDHTENKGMIFISTPFSRAAVDRLERMSVGAYKIGSGECNNLPLVKYIADLGKPIILSTGMNDYGSIDEVVSIIRERAVPFGLMHCTSVYPTPYELVRLGAITGLARRYPDAVVGLSDHTTDNFACLGAVALGACMLERHFTDSKNRPGPDIEVSMDPNDLEELIRGARALGLARGGDKTVLDAEQPTIDFAFATVVTTGPIKKGDTLDSVNLWVKRPGTGEIHARHYESLLGKTAKADLPGDVHLKWSDFG